MGINIALKTARFASNPISANLKMQRLDEGFTSAFLLAILRMNR
jgi:hypothetical protein